MIRLKKLPEDIFQKIPLLKDLLSGNRNVIFAYLFGGILRVTRNPLHDIDIAVFVKDMKKLDYLDMYAAISDILGTNEVDIVILNNSPLSLTGRILQGRELLVDKNPFLRHRYESVHLRKYFDFMIKERDIIKRRYGIG